MPRTLSALLCFTFMSQGCIVYEEPYDQTDCHGSCTGGTWSGTTSTDHQPAIHLFLTEDHGAPGQTLLTSLRTNDPFDYSRVVQVSFEDSVEVVDMMIREDEVVLLLDIDHMAPMGLVEGWADLASGEQVLLGTPFVITEIPDSSCPNGTTTDTGGGTTGGGTDTGTTGGGTTGGGTTGGGTTGGGTTGGGTDTGTADTGTHTDCP